MAVNDHYTREELSKDDFLFISYKHGEKNSVVEDVLSFLYDEGVRFWYDADLVVSENWKKVAEGLIKHEKCRGVIFFNSVESFISEPVHEERGFCCEKIKECEKSGETFRIIPVNIGSPSAIEIMKDVFDRYADDIRGLNRDFPFKYIKNIAALFENDNIYCYADPENKDGYKKSIYETVLRLIPSVVDKSFLQMKKLQDSSGGASVELGVCADKPTGAVPSSLLDKDGRVTLHGITYIIDGGKAYTVKPIHWRVLYPKDDEIVLIAEDTVALRFGGAELNAWLTGGFIESAFTDEQRAAITQIRLLKGEDIAKVNDAKRIAFPETPSNPEGHWWIGDMSYGALQRVVRKEGMVYSMGYNIRTKRSGVRPVITVSKSDLLKLSGMPDGK